IVVALLLRLLLVIRIGLVIPGVLRLLRVGLMIVGAMIRIVAGHVSLRAGNRTVEARPAESLLLEGLLMTGLRRRRNVIAGRAIRGRRLRDARIGGGLRLIICRRLRLIVGGRLLLRI